jgi:hypothetical protein
MRMATHHQPQHQHAHRYADGSGLKSNVILRRATAGCRTAQAIGGFLSCLHQVCGRRRRSLSLGVIHAAGVLWCGQIVCCSLECSGGGVSSLLTLRQGGRSSQVRLATHHQPQHQHPHKYADGSAECEPFVWAIHAAGDGVL